MYLYYGNGDCTVDGDLKIITIIYRGAIKIKDKTPNGYNILSKNNKLMIFPIGQAVALSELFSYEGEFKIVGVRALDMNNDRVYVTVKRVMDYSELMDSNSEDLTTVSEKLNAGYVYGNRVSKTTIEN